MAAERDIDVDRLGDAGASLEIVLLEASRLLRFTDLTVGEVLHSPAAAPGRH